jgi:hypothetical protein
MPMIALAPSFSTVGHTISLLFCSLGAVFPSEIEAFYWSSSDTRGRSISAMRSRLRQASP